jgi:hypothetical protein
VVDRDDAVATDEVDYGLVAAGVRRALVGAEGNCRVHASKTEAGADSSRKIFEIEMPCRGLKGVIWPFGKGFGRDGS